MTDSNPKCICCPNHKCLINICCSKHWKENIDRQRGFGKYKNGQEIFCEDNINMGVYVIYEGKVKLFTTGKKYKQQIVHLGIAGEIIGLRPSDEKNYLIGCSALEDSKLCFIKKDLFFSILNENIELAIGLINYYSHEMADIEIRQKHLSQLSAAAKAAEALLIVKKKFGIPMEKGILLDVNFSRQDMADLAGIAKEEAIRILSLFNKQNLIEIRKKNVILILNEKKLLEMVLEGCCETDSYYDNTAKCSSHLTS